MLDTDVRAFDETLAPGITGIACWTTDTLKSKGSLVTHRSLSEALTRDGQAFLRLMEHGVLTGPGLQFLRTAIVGGTWSGPRVDPNTPDAFIRAGRLAYLWFPDEESDTIRGRFDDLAKITWKALHRVTAAHLVQANGKLSRSSRIGVATEKWVVAHPEQRLVAWNNYLRLQQERPLSAGATSQRDLRQNSASDLGCRGQ